MTRDDYRVECIEAMADAMSKWWIEENMPGWRYLATAAFDALPTSGVRVVPIESTSEMRLAGGMAQQKSMQEYGDPEVVWDAMSAAGDLTNPPEEKP